MEPIETALISQFQQLFHIRRNQFYRISTANKLYAGQLPILEYIHRHEGCTQKEIAAQMNVSPASIASSTKRLQKAGLIRKKADETNLRCNMLYVTEKGIAMAKNCRKQLDQLHQSAFEGLSEKELNELSGTLEKIIANFMPLDIQTNPKQE